MTQEMPTGPGKCVKGDLEKNMSGEQFGFFEMSGEVEDWEKWETFPPFFIQGTVEEIPKFMSDYLEASGRPKPGNKLLSVCKVENQVVYSPLIRWYVELGIKVKVGRGITLTPSKRFKWFPN